MSQSPNICFLPVWLYKVFVRNLENLLNNKHLRLEASIDLLPLEGAVGADRYPVAVVPPHTLFYMG